MAAPSAGSGSLRLNLNPKWPFWVKTPRPVVLEEEVIPPAEFYLDKLSVTMQAVNRSNVI